MPHPLHPDSVAAMVRAAWILCRRGDHKLAQRRLEVLYALLTGGMPRPLCDSPLDTPPRVR